MRIWVTPKISLPFNFVIPAKAGIPLVLPGLGKGRESPAFAGMTERFTK
jgi:hypothetical protein